MKHIKTYCHGIALLLFFFPATSWINVNKNNPAAEIPDEVRIGNQVWMARNLNVSAFRNGDPIPQAKTLAEWRNANSSSQPAWCYYNNDSLNGPVHGKLYNWHAVNDPRGLAPAGWHIPAGTEWRELFDFLKGEYGQAGKKLKSTTGWAKKGNGDNSSGFNALPSGVRSIDMINPNEGFRWMSTLTIWWSKNKPKNYPDIQCFVLRTSDKGSFEWHEQSDGFSVRCVKD